MTLNVSGLSGGAIPLKSSVVLRRLPHLVGEREHIVTYLIYYIGKDFRIF